MNEDKKHINAKDKGLEMADAIQKILDGIANKMTIAKTSFLMQGIKGGLSDWAKAQKELYPRFQAETDKIIKQESKDLNKTLSEIKKTLGFNASQMKTLKDGLNKGLKDTSRLSGLKYKEQVNEWKTQARVLKFDDSKFLNFVSNKASNLRFTDNGVFIERKLDGKEIKRNIRWNNYLDMALRTEVQNYIADNMIASGGDLGVCFYTCVAYGDCAKDHVEAQEQGIFIDARWKDIVNDTYRDKVQEWVDAHPNYMTVQEAKGERGGFFTARPNCRHYFEPIPITDVITISKEKNGLAKYRAKNDLSFKGAYNKDKAEASRKLRNYERRIDLLKTDLESKKMILNSLSGVSLNPQLKIEYYKTKEQVRLAQDKLANAKKEYKQFISNTKSMYEEIENNNTIVQEEPRVVLTIDDLPEEMKNNATKMKTMELLVDYINKSEKADPKIVRLYSSLFKMREKDSKIPFEMKFGKDNAVNTSYYIRTGDIANYEIILADLKKINSERNIHTNLHEMGHLIDLMLRKNKTKPNFFTNDTSYDTILQNNASGISEEVKNLFAKHRKEYDEQTKIANDNIQKIREQQKQLNADFLAQKMDYKTYNKEYKSLNSKIVSEKENIKHKDKLAKVDALEDIYDALSGGKYRDNGTVLFGHGSKEYKKESNRINEIWANYCSLSIRAPELIEMLRRDKPSLVDFLDNITDNIIKGM